MSDSRQATNIAQFFAACAQGDVEALRALLANDPSLARAADPDRPHRGWTGLHAAAERGHAEALRLLLAHGADPNAREEGDKTYALHWAAAHGHLEAGRALLDAGGDVHGIGDVHELDVIGWATVGRPTGDIPSGVLALLLERGARHHIFSAIAAGDLELIRQLVEQTPDALDRRMSRFEQRQTPLHFALSRKRHDILDLLIELGADLEAEDKNGHTALVAAMLAGDREAMGRLHAAGARLPGVIDSSSFGERMAKLAESTTKLVPSIRVPDIAATLAWYTSIGFKEIGRHEADAIVDWGMLSFGTAELMLDLRRKPELPDLSLVFYTDQVDRLYELLKARQLAAAQAALADQPGDPSGRGVEFVEHIYDPFYGGRQFSIRDLNGYTLIFYGE